MTWIALRISLLLPSIAMLPRRKSTNVAAEYVSPTSGSLGGRRPLDIATNQQTFHALTTETLRSESPQSETSSQPQATPSISSRAQTSPRLPPGPSGLRRKSTQRKTYDTYASALEEQVPASPQSPSTMPIPGPLFPQAPGNPPRQPAPGGGVGGFATAATSHYDSRKNTADYNYRFDTMASARSDSSGPPQYESAAVTGGIHAKVWPTYNRISKEVDDKMLEKSNSDLDVLLIFAALFSAIVTAFLIRALDDLGPNYQQQSALLLHQILNGRDPSLETISDPTIPFRASALAVAVNCLWFASLAASLGASFGAMICKEWLTEYQDPW